ncbi:uncharacterized protein LOC127627988 [Xyrauchen texanus]|uniref:uncharacterized protein LOC127627988 n=1 Tax=Xyrauchen texanus TaxID=154827 RepID=UPI00224293D1|nr:uncharacterized protein LOC127627988 [Xyrauchen texanus]
MKKHVKFLENNSNKSGLYHKTSLLPLRSSGLNHVDGDKTNPKFGHGMQKATVKVAEQNRDMRTIQIPKTMTAAPFLQHPGLTPGQKRFLYSIAEAYSTDQMRQLICQHYMNVLHRCIRTDLKVNVKQPRSIYAPEVEYITNPQTTTCKTKESGKRYLTAEKVKKTTFPKIIDHQRVSMRLQKSITVQSRTRRMKSKTTLAKHAPLQGSHLSDVDMEWEVTDVDTYLSGQMSGLAFNDSRKRTSYSLSKIRLIYALQIDENSHTPKNYNAVLSERLIHTF